MVRVAVHSSILRAEERGGLQSMGLHDGLSIPGSHAPFAGRVSLGLASLSPVVAGEVSDAKGLEFLSQIPLPPRKKLQSFFHPCSGE